MASPALVDYCPDCGGHIPSDGCWCADETLCVEVRAGEPLAVDPERRAGEVLYLEQCDGCGCCRFAVERGGVRCLGDEDDETGEQIEGCGTFYAFQIRPAREVIF